MSEEKNTMKFMVFKAVAALLLLAVLIYGGFQWLICRVYVPAGRMAVVTAKSGSEPKSGSILVEKGEKGIWREVLAEGRHFLNPFYYDVKLVPAVSVPLGKVGIVTSKVGRELPPGEIIAPDRESKGVWRDVLGPGLYRLNPEGYQVDIVDAVNIPIGYVGVVTSQTGKAPGRGAFAAGGEKGVLKDILQPGLYYLNRYAYQVNVFEIGMNQVTMASESNESAVTTKNRLRNANNALQDLEAQTLNFQTELRKQVAIRKEKADASSMRVGRAMGAKAPEAAGAPQDASRDAQIFGISRAVEFPSRDGFKVTMDMTVEFELMPESIARIYLLYGDLPQVVEKIILPQVLSASRLKGSSYRAQDFIMGEGRETFQHDLRQELVKSLASKNIIVHNAIIRSVEVPENILSPIRAVSLAKEQNLTNLSLQDTAKKLAELNTETELIEQRRREVGQETEKLTAKIAAERNQEVAGIEAETAREVAGIRLKKADFVAKTALVKGEAEVKAAYLVNREKARGEILKGQALGGGEKMAKYQLVNTLNPKVETTIIHAGEGTLWTDLKNATLPLPAKK